MRNRFIHIKPIFDYLGGLFWIFGFVILTPLLPLILYSRMGHGEVHPLSYLLPAFISLLLGVLLKRRIAFEPIDQRGAMLLCSLGWITISALGALPFTIGIKMGYLDAYFETVSGFTTTGITMLQGIDALPRSIIFWRALTQWLGGLGILTFFLTVVSAGGTAHRLFSAESHKIFSKRPAPGLFHTLQILWTIYVLISLISIFALVLEGLSLFDAMAHTFTAISTGGYSPYDASIGHYQQAGYAHYRAIEYTLTLVMLLGGMNFFIHYRVLTGQLQALWDNLEMKLWWAFVAGATLLILLNGFMNFGLPNPLEETVRHTLFQVVAILTTTGFATKDIGDAALYPALAKQIFLVLMVVGGCVGSTGGGIKVLRIGVLFKMVGRQIKRVVYGPRAVNLLMIDGEILEQEEIRRIGALFFAWITLLFVGGAITALLSRHGALASFSGMCSALGNIGPCYITVGDVTRLHPAIKITYILGMLAGRLEILPVLLLFSRRSWK
jgi:trk system potassium uptake protein TrkH